MTSRRGKNHPTEGVHSAVDAMPIWTIGHSTRTVEEFLQLLHDHRIEVLIDVRTFPGSRRYPHFNREQLSQTLQSAHIQYRHMSELGGRRKARPDSKNIAWRNEGFRGYADYMETEMFKQGIEDLVEIGKRKRTTVMCAEAVWWRCHRSMIADYLKASGVEVIHILSSSKAEPHPFTPVARIVNGKLSYEGLLPG